LKFVGTCLSNCKTKGIGIYRTKTQYKGEHYLKHAFLHRYRPCQIRFIKEVKVINFIIIVIENLLF